MEWKMETGGWRMLRKGEAIRPRSAQKKTRIDQIFLFSRRSLTGTRALLWAAAVIDRLLNDARVRAGSNDRSGRPACLRSCHSQFTGFPVHPSRAVPVYLRTVAGLLQHWHVFVPETLLFRRFSFMTRGSAAGGIASRNIGGPPPVNRRFTANRAG